MTKSFVNLHNHSFYSILEAVDSPSLICDKAKELELPAVALTDSGVGYGLFEFYQSAKKKGIKPILGAEIFVAKDSRFERRAGIDGREGSIVLLAKNLAGYKNLLKILSHAHLDGFYYKPRADFEILSKYSKDLFVLTGATGGAVGKLFRDFGEDKAYEFFQKLQTTFEPENVLVELVARSFDEQKELNKFKLKLADKFKAKLVATSDARYLEKEDEVAADTLSCIGRNQNFFDENRFKFAEKNWFKNWEEICTDLDFIAPDILEQARENTLEIAEKIDFKISTDKNLLPHFSVLEGETEASQLRKNCEKNISSRYGQQISKNKDFQKVVDDRLDYELSVIENMGFSAYFLIVEDFVNFAKKNEIAVGPGRGSAAGSIVSYLLEITSIDPLKYDLLFERFLNPERVSMPDIDIDFSDERRDEVLQYVIEKYGTEKVSKVCTFGTLAAKAALKDVGRAYGVAFAEMNAMTKILPNRPGFTLADAEKIADFTALVNSKPHLKEVFIVAKKLEGCVRHVSVHACAVIIGRDDLTQNTPLQWAPGADEIKITQFPYQQLEKIGLLKMDFLGLKNLSIIEKAVANIEKSTGEKLDLNLIALDDPKTFDLFARGDTTGVFQFESAGMRRYLRELCPTEFEDLVAMNALYRPGPMEFIPKYIEGKRDPDSVKYLHPVLEPILKKTYGIAVYQEQIQRIVQDFAGFSLGEGYLLIKAVAKKIASLLKKQREKFFEMAQQKGHSKKVAEKIFDFIEPFANYGFNRSHAVCYARIAYETAYLRANFPVEFMAAMMTTDRNNTDRIVLEMNECSAMEIEVLPPAINESGAHFTVIFDKIDESQTEIENEETSQNNKKMRFGLTAIKGLGEETVDQIIFERNKKRFVDLADFARRVPQKLLNKKTLEALAFSGAFDEFGDRKAIVDSLDDLARFAKEFQDKSEAGQMGLFGGIEDTAIEFSLKKTVATKEDILRWERESLGLFVSDHPCRGLQKYFEKYGKLIGKITADDVEQKCTIHGIVVAVRRIMTRAGKPMAILEIEDTTGKIELAIFPMIFGRIPQKALEVDAFIRVRGKISERDGVFNLIVDEIKAGNLQEAHKSVLNFAEKECRDTVHRVSTANPKIFTINIPNGTTKDKVDNLKKFLIIKKAEEGVAVEMVLGEKRVQVPFKIEFFKELQKEIDKILTKK